jgi:tight adherence protein B
MQPLFIIIVLITLIGAAAAALWLDARQRRIDRQVEIALSKAQSQRAPSIRRVPVESRWLLLHRMANYRAGIPYVVRPQ